MQNILYTTDFSKNAENALPFAIHLIKKLKGKLYLLHAYEHPMISLEEVFSFDTKIEYIEKIVNGVRLKAHHKLNQIINNYGLSNIEHRALLRKGNIKKEVQKAIKNNDIDLVVMGTRGEAAENGWFMGSITKNIIQHVNCPVFAIPKSAQFNKISKIVYLNNLKYDETNIINRIVEFAKMYNADIVILHLMINNNKSNILEKRKIEQLKKIINNVVYPKISYKEIVSKNIIDGINEYIKKNEQNVIAMTTYTTTLFDKLFHKSLTKQVLLHTQIPLLAFNGNLL